MNNEGRGTEEGCAKVLPVVTESGRDQLRNGWHLIATSEDNILSPPHDDHDTFLVNNLEPQGEQQDTSPLQTPSTLFKVTSNAHHVAMVPAPVRYLTKTHRLPQSVHVKGRKV